MILSKGALTSGQSPQCALRGVTKTKRGATIMAIYHCSISNVSRAKGSSSLATLAYITGQKIRDERTGNLYNYSRKERILTVNTILPLSAPNEYANTETLFNSIERYETADNARTAKKIVLALPKELNLATNIQITEDYIKNNLTKKGYCVTYAIHDGGQKKNIHAHILVANRAVNTKGEWATMTKSSYIYDERGQKIPQFDPKKLKAYEIQHNAPFDLNKLEQELDRKGLNQKDRAEARQIILDEVQAVRVRKGKGTERKWQRQNIEENPLDKRDFLKELREQWAVEVNKYLDPSQYIDHRSNEARGIEDTPTKHEGYVARKIEEKGGVSERCEINREIQRINEERRKMYEEILVLQAELERLEQEESEEVERIRAIRAGIERRKRAIIPRIDASTNRNTNIESQRTSDIGTGNNNQRATIRDYVAEAEEYRFRETEREITRIIEEREEAERRERERQERDKKIREAEQRKRTAEATRQARNNSIKTTNRGFSR